MAKEKGPWTVLLVDDDEDIREAMRDALELRAFHVVHARNGLDALAALRSVHVDLIVLDLTMPQMDGWQFLDRRAIDPRLERIPVLVVTAMENRRVATDERIQGVMWKPFHRDQFVDLVARSTRPDSRP